MGNTLNVPDGWANPFFGWDLDLELVSNIVNDANKKIADDGFSPVWILFYDDAVQRSICSLAGPAPNYDMQKILVNTSPKEASKMTGFVSIVLLPVRYSMVIGLTVLAILYYNQLEYLERNRWNRF